ncbi:MAG: hypothetical protein IMZ55_05240, partial [Acidobacteria bacterium]|nr:hypothetical protein [Acidobacteriota bacterium]
MTHGMLVALAGVVLVAGAAALAAGPAEPLRLHPENPHYFLWRGKPAVLITSGEHYGSVLNLEFDYAAYLDEIARSGLNLTRTFSGVYREVPGNFGITGNTLAPKPDRYLAPWARSATGGATGGGNKFDLAKWDDAYFRRLKDFLAQAAARGIVVELVLFCPMYEDAMWHASPMYAGNNVSGAGNLKKDEAHTLKNGPLLAFQVAVAKKIVTECNPFDNLYYEICNEPYFGGVTLDWQKRIADTIVATEKGLPKKHLIAQNIANGSCKIEAPNPDVSIFNFHYCSPPDAVGMNWGLGRAIADDETGFKGSADVPYRPDAWDFILAGGAVYSNLDYSFRSDNPHGTAQPKAPGGGGKNLRAQLAILKGFIEGFDFLRMAPDGAVVAGGVPPKATARALAEKGRQYAVFVRGGTRADLILDLPKG